MNTYENYHQPESPPYVDQCYCHNQFYEPCQVCCQPSHAECCEDICEIKNEILHKKCSVVKLVKDQIDKLKECQCLKDPQYPVPPESPPQVNNEGRAVANARRNLNYPELSERLELPSSGSPSSGSPLSSLDENEYENLADDRARPKFKKWPRNRFIRIALLMFGAYVVWLLFMYIALLLGFFCDDYRNQGAYCSHCWLAGQVWLRFLPGLQWQRPKYYAM